VTHVGQPEARATRLGTPRFGGALRGAQSVPSFRHTCDPETGEVVDEELRGAVREAVAGISED